ncbi:DUF397 domain-containing protein [Streptomyces pratensis]|uniref:DUF397 domain-containing protein n=1 Tax=Streptomyces pratensis TaxID=1169025 RepID=UPI0019348ADF
MNPETGEQHPDAHSWSKSSYSSNEGGECVEVAATDHAVLVRDSKDLTRPHLAVGPTGWADFVLYAPGPDLPERGAPPASGPRTPTVRQIFPAPAPAVTDAATEEAGSGV